MLNPGEGYNIQRPMNHCLLCGADIVMKERHPSLIDYSEEDSVRKDYCFECWSKLNNHKFFSFWIAKRIKPDPDKKITRLERNRTLLQLFLSLYASQERAGFRAHLFLISHLLMRYQVFKWKETKTIAELDSAQLQKLNLELLPPLSKDGAQHEEAGHGDEAQIPEEFVPSSFIVFIQKETGEEFIIEDIPLDDEKFLEIKRELDSQLDGKEL